MSGGDARRYRRRLLTACTPARDATPTSTSAAVPASEDDALVVKPTPLTCRGDADLTAERLTPGSHVAFVWQVSGDAYAELGRVSVDADGRAELHVSHFPVGEGCRRQPVRLWLFSVTVDGDLGSRLLSRDVPVRTGARLPPRLRRRLALLPRLEPQGWTATRQAR